MARNTNLTKFEYFNQESDYASPAEMTDIARERINLRKERTARAGRRVLEVFNQNW